MPRRTSTACAACRRMFDEQRRLLQDIDGQLALALDVEPSPCFVPEVLARVDRSAFRFRSAMWWGGAAAAAAVLMLVALGSLRSGERRDDDRRAAAVPAGVSSPPVGDRTPSQVTPSPSPGAKSRQTDSRRRVDRPQGVVDRPSRIEADVVIPATESRALARYLALVRGGALDTSNPRQLGRDRRRGAHGGRHRAARRRHSCRHGCESRNRSRQSTRIWNQIRSVVMRSEFVGGAGNRGGHADAGRRARQAAAIDRPAGRRARGGARSVESSAHAHAVQGRQEGQQRSLHAGCPDELAEDQPAHGGAGARADDRLRRQVRGRCLLSATDQLQLSGRRHQYRLRGRTTWGKALFNLVIAVDDSTLFLDRSAESAEDKKLPRDIPAFRSFRVSFAILLRDGQTMHYASATDPISGEVMRIEVSLSLAK